MRLFVTGLIETLFLLEVRPPPERGRRRTPLGLPLHRGLEASPSFLFVESEITLTRTTWCVSAALHSPFSPSYFRRHDMGLTPRKERPITFLFSRAAFLFPLSLRKHVSTSLPEKTRRRSFFRPSACFFPVEERLLARGAKSE